jgi:hypothetical protein
MENELCFPSTANNEHLSMTYVSANVPIYAQMHLGGLETEN